MTITKTITANNVWEKADPTAATEAKVILVENVTPNNVEVYVGTVAPPANIGHLAVKNDKFPVNLASGDFIWVKGTTGSILLAS